MKWLGVVLIALAGFLAGGVISFWRNDSRFAAVIMGLLTVMAAGGGIAWMIAG